MKQILLSFLLLSLAATCFAQYADTTKQSIATNYLKKSKNQKTAAWLLVGGGAVVTTVGMVVGFGEVTDAIITSFSGEEQSSFSAGALLTLTGLTAMVGSIPLFIAAGKNRRKAAASVSFKVENATNIYQLAVTNTRYPAVAIHIRL